MPEVYALHKKAQSPDGIGLPKPAVQEIIVTARGVVGDHNHFRSQKRRNTPDRALLIMPLEMLAQLQVEGWPVRPGDIGENVTTMGVAYEALAVGNRYRIGGVELTLTEPCTPCMKLQNLPYVGERVHEFMRTMVGRRGWYASVQQEGTIHLADLIDRI